MSQNALKPNQSSSSEEEASGSEDEYTSGTESDEASDTDSGEKQKQVTAPPQSANKPQPPDASSSEPEQLGSDSDSDSDTDSDPPPTKPMENLDSKLGKSNGSKTASTPPPAKSKRPPPAPAANQNDTKKPKIQILLNRKTENGDPKKPQAPDPSSSEPEQSSSETDSGSDSDSDSPPKTTSSVDPNVKPISSKPMDENNERNLEPKLGKKDGSKMTSSSPVKSKRPAPSPTANEKDTKKAKTVTGTSNQSEPEGSGSGSDTESDSPPKKSAPSKPTASKAMDREVERKVESKLAKKDGAKTTTKQPQKSKGTEEDSKKQMFQRLWSEDDEIAILEGMIGYKTEKDGANPVAEIGAFHEFIKKSLHVEVSNTQLADKIRRLKKKYMTNVSREKDGKEISFSKSHEQKGYELSKRIWGGSSNNSRNSVTVSKKKGTAASTSTITSTGTGTVTANVLKSNGVDVHDHDHVKEKKTEVEKMDISRFVRYGGGNGFPVLPEEIVKAGMELVDGPRRAEMEEKWKKLMEEELVLYVKRMELLKEQAQMVLEAIGSSRN